MIKNDGGIKAVLDKFFLVVDVDGTAQRKCKGIFSCNEIKWIRSYLYREHLSWLFTDP